MYVATLAVLMSVAAATGAADAPSRPSVDPYLRYVVASEALVRSGPGEEHYPTSRLALGAAVEVYDQKPGGWLAIRPPRGSFCWAPQVLLQSTSGSAIASVTQDNLAAWIGSELGRVRQHRYQVQLKTGEKVEILGVYRRADDDGKVQVWCKIAPPAGDFRWIHRGDVHISAPDVLDQTEPPPSPSAALLLSRVAIAPRNITNDGNDTRETIEMLKRATAAIRGGRVINDAASPAALLPEAAQTVVEAADGQLDAKWTPRDDSNALAPPANSSNSASPAAFAAVELKARPTTAPLPAAATPLTATPLTRTQPAMKDHFTSSEFAAELVEIDMQLSLMVAQQIATWRLARSRGRAAHLLEVGRTALQRGRAQRLLDTISQFEQLQARTLAVAKTAPQSRPAAVLQTFESATAPIGAGVRQRDQPRRDRLRTVDYEAPAKPTTPAPQSLLTTARLKLQAALPIAAISKTLASPAASRPAEYDGAGWLMPVHSINRATPPFALVDADGRLRQYVSPSPGLNLYRYREQRVGIIGQRDRIASLDAPHLTAARVIVLERR